MSGTRWLDCVKPPPDTRIPSPSAACVEEGDPDTGTAGGNAVQVEGKERWTHWLRAGGEAGMVGEEDRARGTSALVGISVKAALIFTLE